MENRLHKIQYSELYKNLVEPPLVDYSKMTYSSNNFYEYYDSTLEAFDAFYKKYNLLLLLGTGNYDNFPDGTSQFIDFKDMEHSIGISSFGQNDFDAKDFLNDLLNCLSLPQPNENLVNEFINVDSPFIDLIINRWNEYKLIDLIQYETINYILKKYKNVNDVIIQKKLLKLSNVLLEVAYFQKEDLIRYRTDIKQREDNIINDLIYFIDNITNPRIKSLLFKYDDFENMRTYDKNNTDEYDEKTIVLGYFTNYLSSKYDLNNTSSSTGINVGKLINTAKQRYNSYYTEQVILDIMNNKANTIRKKLIAYIKDRNDYFNQNLSDTINQVSYTILTKDNIDIWYDKLCNNNNIEDMITVNDMSKNILEQIDNNKKDIEEAEYKEIELKDKCNDLLSKLRKKYSNLSDEEFDTLLTSMIRNKNINGKITTLEQEVIISYRKYNNTLKKIHSLKEYSQKLEKFALKSTNYKEKVEKRLLELLEEYINGNLDINQNEIVKIFICNLLHNNYYEDVTREIKARNTNDNLKTNFLDNIINNHVTDDFEIINKKIKMTPIFDNLTGYDTSDSDYDNALKLVSEIYDNYTLTYAYSLKNTHSINSIINAFKHNKDGLSIIHLIHALMKDTNVESFLEQRFSSQRGISFNYDKVLYKCLSMSSIDEILSTRARVIKTVDKVKIKGIPKINEEEVSRKISEINCPYILLLGGTGDTKTLVYLSEVEDISYSPNNKSLPDENGKLYKLIPLHALKFDVKDELKLLFTELDIINGKYLPQRRNVLLTTGIELESSSESEIVKR